VSTWLVKRTAFLPVFMSKIAIYCYSYSHLWAFFRKNYDINAKSANRDIFFKIFLGKTSFIRIIEDIDKMGKIKDAQKA